MARVVPENDEVIGKQRAGLGVLTSQDDVFPAIAGEIPERQS